MVFLKRYPNPYFFNPYPPNPFPYPYSYSYYNPYSYPYLPVTQYGSCDCALGGAVGSHVSNNCANGAVPICVPGRNCICYNPYTNQGGCFNETNRSCSYR